MEIGVGGKYRIKNGEKKRAEDTRIGEESNNPGRREQTVEKKKEDRWY